MEIKSTLNNEYLSIQHSLIISKIKNQIKNYPNLKTILNELPNGSIIVGGYIRDLILDRLSPYPDIDLVVPNNSLKIGKNIAEKFSGKFLILDQDRNIVRIIFRNFTVDIASQTHELLAEDLKSRDFTINSVGFSFNNGQLIDPANGICDINNSLLRSFRYENLIDDPLRILRCFRFISDIPFAGSINFPLLNEKPTELIVKSLLSKSSTNNSCV